MENPLVLSAAALAAMRGLQRGIAAVRALDNDEHAAWRLLPQPQRLEGITARTLIVATT